MATTRAMIERRRASRVPMRIPVTIFRDEAEGEPLTLAALAVGVSRCGALLRVPFSPEIGSRLQLRNDSSHKCREFRVIRVSEPKRDGTWEIGVEMLYPTRSFWGVRFPDDTADDSAASADPADLEIHQFPRV